MKGIANPVPKSKFLVCKRFLPTAKSLNYMTAVVAMQQAKKQGAQEVLYIGSSGNILEGSTMNFFAVQKGVIYTTETDILFGITRQFDIELLE